MESIRADLPGSLSFRQASVCKHGQLWVSTSSRMKVTVAFVKTAKSPHEEKILSLFVFVFKVRAWKHSRPVNYPIKTKALRKWHRVNRMCDAGFPALALTDCWAYSSWVYSVVQWDDAWVLLTFEASHLEATFNFYSALSKSQPRTLFLNFRGVTYKIKYW